LLLAGLIAGIAPVLGYTALSLGLVGYVTTLFKLSTLMTVLWGGLLLGESGLRRRLPASLVMVAGAVLITSDCDNLSQCNISFLFIQSNYILCNCICRHRRLFLIDRVWPDSKQTDLLARLSRISGITVTNFIWCSSEGVSTPRSQKEMVLLYQRQGVKKFDGELLSD
jgi:hypothetical protein